MMAAINEKPPELVNRMSMIFYQDNITAYQKVFDSSTVFSRHCIFGWIFSLVFTEFSLEKKIKSLQDDETSQAVLWK